MPQIESQSQLSSHPARSFFTPSWAEAGLYLMLSAILLVVFNSRTIMHRLGIYYQGSPQGLQANFSTFFNGLSHSFSTALGGRLGQIVVWSFVGAMSYIILWLIRNIFSSFENDIISARYLHPSTYSRSGYWASSFSVKIFLAATLLITTVYCFIGIRAILPAAASLAGSSIYNVHWPASPLFLLASILGVALVIYIAVIFLKLISHLWALL